MAQRKEIGASAWRGESYLTFIIQEMKWILLSSLYVEATEVKIMRFKVKVCRDTGSSTEISSCSPSDEG